MLSADQVGNHMHYQMSFVPTNSYLRRRCSLSDGVLQGSGCPYGENKAQALHMVKYGASGSLSVRSSMFCMREVAL